MTLNFYYDNTTENPASGGTYIEGVMGQPTFINPLIAQINEIDRDLIEVLFSNLFDLTENYKTDSDNKIWTVSLKKNLKWDDGHDLTADDVVFTIKTIQELENNTPDFSFWSEVAIQKINDHELVFELKGYLNSFLDNLKTLKITPKHIFGNIPPMNLKLSQYNLEPVGSGPYKFVRLATEKNGFISQIHLTANPLYHDKKAFMSNLVFKFYIDESELIKDFNLKKISGFGGIDPKNIEELKINHKIYNLNLPRYYAIFFNNANQKVLQEKEVGRALNLATNRKELIQKIFNGYAAISDGPIPASLNSYDKKIYEDDLFSPEEARKLLERAGWLINPEDNVRYKTTKKNREKLEFDMIVPQIPFLMEAADLIKKDWSKLGVMLNIIIVNINDINKELIKTRNYQMLLFGNMLSGNADIFSFWHSSERFYPGLNLSLYNNKEVDRILEEIRKNYDQQKIKGALVKIQQIIHEDIPAVFLFNPNYIYTTTDDLHGFNLSNLNSQSNRFEKINHWHLKIKRRFAKNT